MLKTLLVLAIIGIILYTLLKSPHTPVTRKNPEISSSTTRPIIFIIIDSLMDPSLQEVIRLGKAPAMKFLMDRGHYYPQIVSSFPTMSVCIDTTLLTGVRPNEHHIFGLTHYLPQDRKIINFGTGMKEILSFGIRDVLTDSLQSLNQTLISKNVTTIHEAYPGPTASINALIYRGNKKHEIGLPWIARLLGIPTKIPTMGPEIFSFGSMHAINPDNTYGAPWLRYGMNDRFSRMEITSLIKNKQLPPFTILYLPSNDEYLHRNGPHELKGIEEADQELQKILDSFSSWEKAIDSTTFIILGDSGHTQTLTDHETAYIPLRKILHSYIITPTKNRHPDPNDQIVLCVNERMAYIYPIDDKIPTQEIVDHLRQDSRLDIIAWKQDKKIHVVSGRTKGKFEYKPHGNYTDTYNQSWDIHGEHNILNLFVSDEKRISYGEYPDALFRLEGVMDTYDRVIVVTCAPGYELVSDHSPKHSGGSHGSLHYLDSNIPMIVTGTNTRPGHLRLIDIKKWILHLLQ